MAGTAVPSSFIVVTITAASRLGVGTKKGDGKFVLSISYIAESSNSSKAVSRVSRKVILVCRSRSSVSPKDHDKTSKDLLTHPKRVLVT